jgi:2-polyprenyl-6-hydroxyphenyl methylase / 3-demethylubiquinone-9 3-methyltransferase
LHQTLDYRRCNQCEMLYISPAPTEAQHLDYVVNSTAMTYWRDNMPEEMKKSRRPMYVDRVEFVLGALSRMGIDPKTCLEIGAGNGEFAEELSARVALDRLCLLEPQDMDIDVPNLHVIKAGFVALEELDEKFDFIVAFELIEHLLEPDNFMRLMRRVLKPGAPIILSTPNERSVETRTLGRHSSNILFDHVRLYNPEAMTRMLARNGFKVVEIHTPGELDVERLKGYFAKNPEALEANPALKLALGSGLETEQAFQCFLVDNHLSSHMRVVAVVDGDWQGGHPPILS